MSFFSLLFLIFSVGSYTLNAQEETFDKQQWEKAIEGIDYGDIVNEKEKPITRDRSLHRSTGGGGAGIMRIILFAAIILILLFILYKIFGDMAFGGKVSRVNQKNFSIEDIEENLDEADLDFHLNMSLESRDFRKAIRIYYLAIIKELSGRDWIRWKKDKTNFQYVREMKSRKEFYSFRDLTSAFEIVWYGDGEIRQDHFDNLKPIFKGFIKDLEEIEE